MCEIVGGGVGKLNGSLAVGLDAQVMLGGPREAVIPTETAAALEEKRVGELRVPPRQVVGRIGGLPDCTIHDPSVEVRIPRICGDPNQQRSHTCGVDVSCIDHESKLNTIGIPCCDRRDTEPLGHWAVDRGFRVDSDPHSGSKRLIEQGQIGRITNERAWHFGRIANLHRRTSVSQRLHPETTLTDGYDKRRQWCCPTNSAMMATTRSASSWCMM